MAILGITSLITPFPVPHSPFPLSVLVLAAIRSIAEALGISAMAHTTIADLWLKPDQTTTALMRLVDFAIAAALAVSARRRLLAALSEGVRAIARPVLFRDSPAARDAALVVVASLISIVVETILRPHLAMSLQTPLAVGLGLVVTGIALASTRLAPKAAVDSPSLGSMIAVGLVHGLAAAPGGSRVAATLVLLLWLGVSPTRSVDLVFLISAPTLILTAIANQGPPLTWVTLSVAALLIAFVCAYVASIVLRRLAERRLVAALALWVIPLGLATLAYARAL